MSDRGRVMAGQWIRFTTAAQCGSGGGGAPTTLCNVIHYSW
ncbi:hypothetical protein ACFY20_15300 [Streptomyces sp. NPDC001312]